MVPTDGKDDDNLPIDESEPELRFDAIPILSSAGELMLECILEGVRLGPGDGVLKC